MHYAVDVVLRDDQVDHLKHDLRIAGDRGIMPDAQALIRRVDQDPGDFGVILAAQTVEVVQQRCGTLLDGEAIGRRCIPRRCCGRVHIRLAKVAGCSIDLLWCRIYRLLPTQLYGIACELAISSIVRHASNAGGVGGRPTTRYRQYHKAADKRQDGNEGENYTQLRAFRKRHT